MHGGGETLWFGCCRVASREGICSETSLRLCSLPALSPPPPSQANVTKLVQTKLKAITLGIGDGANDVGMIQVWMCGGSANLCRMCG